MAYNNLIYFLVVIFIFSSNTAPESTDLPAWIEVVGLITLPILFYFISGKMHSGSRTASGSSTQYFKAEKKLSILALLFFVAAVYLFELKYYLQPLSLNAQMPILVNFAGLCYFFVLLGAMWSQAMRAYQVIFGRDYSRWGFIGSNLKLNLPIVLPWLLISLFFDTLGLLEIPGLNKFMDSSWGDFLFFVVFVFFLALFFPPLIKRLWNCTPLPEGALRTRLESFCHKNKFYSPILLWPLFEGQVITAGIMGFVPRFRYLLVTPALLSTMSSEEVDSVLAHEIGHVRKKHLFLYLFLFFGFSLLLSTLITPLPYLIYSSDLFYKVQEFFQISIQAFQNFVLISLILILLLVYFRFTFGYFIRNFERQADLEVFELIGSPQPLINAFEKIALLSGNIRSQKSWHHFGIGERIDFLKLCRRDGNEIKKHHCKVYLSLGLYMVVLLVSISLIGKINIEEMAQAVTFRHLNTYLQLELKKQPENNHILLAMGDLMMKNNLEEKAISAYEKAVALKPLDAETKNKLAWLLLTAENKSLRDPRKALTLARSAITIKQRGYIYDTLATAFWANGLGEDAVLTELKAIKMDPDNHKFYKKQLQKFSQKKWGQDE